MTQQTKAVPSFKELGISPNLLSIVEKQYDTPTPIQHQVIPPAIEGKDIVGIAQTGTGKTLAFGIPLLQRIAGDNGQALVILPTRELAIQVEEMLQKIGRSLYLKTAVLIGGTPIYRQIQALKRRPNVIIATPGRLADHLRQKTCSLKNIRIVVLDEADRMLDIGFAPQIKEILNNAPVERQTLLFSATMPPEIAKMAATYMKLPLRIEVAPAGTTASHIEQEVIITRSDMKMKLLDSILTENPGTILVFSRTKHGAAKIATSIRTMGHTAIEIHSNRSLGQRREALAGFKAGRYRVLIATDIASRGIDVNDISLVINYDLPDNSEDYVHRIGRTGRAGKQGKAISFATSQDRQSIKSIERLIKKTLPIANSPFSLEPIIPSRSSARYSRTRNTQKRRFSKMYR